MHYEYAKNLKSDPGLRERVREDKCPLCGYAVTYRGFIAVECGTRSGCPNYAAPPPTVHRVGSTDIHFGDPFGDEPTLPGMPMLSGVLSARTLLLAGSKVEYRVRNQLNTPSMTYGPGPWFPILDLADLQFLQGNVTDASMDSLFDFQAR